MRTTLSPTDPLLVPMEVVDLGAEVVTVLVEGDIDLSGSGELRAVLSDASSGPQHTVIVDLSGVHFIGSSGLGVLAELGARLGRDERILMIRGCRPSILRAFEVTGLDRHLDVD